MAMLRLMRCRCIQLLGEREVLFWALAFPIILGTMFAFALTNLVGADLVAIPVAIVVTEENEQSEQFQNFVNEAVDILNAKAMDEQTALQQLEMGEIEGIYETGTTHKLVVAKSNLNASILQALLEAYQRNEQMIMEIVQSHPENLEKAIAKMADYKSMTTSVDLSGAAQNSAMPYFLALIGMTCLYGCYLGMKCPMDMQANLSALGARRSITPTNRLKLLIADMLATFAIHFGIIIIFLIYLRFVLKVDIGTNVGAILLVSAVGSMMGVSLGMFIGSLGKLEAEKKRVIISAVSMVCSFLAGLMVGAMKDIVERNAPIINRINPAALIADAFYSLSIYHDMPRFYHNVITLLGISILLLGISFVRVRRERYDSI